MNTVELRIKEGPTKPDLQWAVSHPDRQIHVHFDAVDDAVDAHVDTMAELYIPQCDRQHEHCIKRSFTASAAAECRKSRQACRSATVNEAIRNSGMSATELFDMRSPRRTDEQEGPHR
jgi:hypothetical protein